eukprot:scaffold9888_cov123-Isochrysis_galbana.AAC.1
MADIRSVTYPGWSYTQLITWGPTTNTVSITEPTRPVSSATKSKPTTSSRPNEVHAQRLRVHMGVSPSSSSIWLSPNVWDAAAGASPGVSTGVVGILSPLGISSNCVTFTFRVKICVCFYIFFT